MKVTYLALSLDVILIPLSLQLNTKSAPTFSFSTKISLRFLVIIHNLCFHLCPPHLALHFLASPPFIHPSRPIYTPPPPYGRFYTLSSLILQACSCGLGDRRSCDSVGVSPKPHPLHLSSFFTHTPYFKLVLHRLCRLAWC